MRRARALTMAAIALATTAMLFSKAETAWAWDSQWDPPTAAAELLARARNKQWNLFPFWGDSDWQYDRPGFGACYLIKVPGPDGPRLVRACP